MAGSRVVIYLQPGTVPTDRQAQFCLAYCEERGHTVVAVAPPSAPVDAVTIVARGWADLVVTAYSPRPRADDIRALAREAGVRLEYVRPPMVRREASEMIASIYRNSDGDVGLVARLVGLRTQDIREILVRMGIRPRGNGTAPRSPE